MNCVKNFKNCQAKCCTFFQISIYPDKDMIRYLRLHGLDVDDCGIIHFPIPCKMLDIKTGKCKIYQDRPKICRIYPRPQDPVPPGCVYGKIDKEAKTAARDPKEDGRVGRTKETNS